MIVRAKCRGFGLIMIALVAAGCDGGSPSIEEVRTDRTERELGLVAPYRLLQVSSIDDGGSVFILVGEVNGDSLQLVMPSRLVGIALADGRTSGDLVLHARDESLVVRHDVAANMDSILDRWPAMYPYLHLHGRPGDPRARRLEPRSPAESAAVDLLRWLVASPGTAPSDTASLASVVRRVEQWRRKPWIEP